MSAVLGMGMMAGCVAELIDECDRVCLMSVCGLGQPLYLYLCMYPPSLYQSYLYLLSTHNPNCSE